METTAPTVVREEPAPCRVKLNIEVPHEQVAATFRAVEKEFKKAAKIPGFRPGKAPRQLLWRRHGDDIRKEAKDRLLRSSLRTVIEQEDLKPETSPRIDNQDNLTADPDNSFVYAAEFDVPPEFELPTYKGISVSRESVTVGDEHIQEVIDQMLTSRTSYDKVDRPAEAEDLLKVSYEGKLDEEVEDLPESAKYLLGAEGTWLALREPEILPGATEQLKGSAAGDTKEMNVTFPDEFHEPTLAGKSATYNVTVQEVHAATVPELTDDIAKELGAEDVDDAKERIRQNIEHREKAEQDRAVRDQILQKLLGKVDFPLPPQMLARETYSVLQRLYQEQVRNGVAEDELKGQGEQLHQQAEEIAKRQLKQHYLLAKIADQENIDVNPNEVQQMVQYLAATNRTNAEDMMKRLQENGRILDLVNHIRENKTLDVLVEQADIQNDETDQAVTVETEETGETQT